MKNLRLNRSKTEIRIPKSTIEPINRRIFVLTEEVPTFKTRSGVSIAGVVFSDRGQRMERIRYYVIAVAEDTNFILEESVGPVRQPITIERGDMVWGLTMPDAVMLKLPQVVDWESEASWPVYEVLEIHELAGVKKMKDIKDRKIILE